MNAKKEAENLISVLKNIFGADKVPIEREINVSELYDFARFHKLDHLLYRLIGIVDMSEDEKKKLEYSHNFGLFVCAKQDFYIELIREELNKRKIKHIFLKGSVLKKLYPSPDMRQSSDIDILIDPDRAKDVKVFMEELGFKTVLFGTDQDVYVLDGLVNVEMHRTMVPDHSKWYSVTEEMRKRAVLKVGFEYELTAEDFYLFTIIHIAKHVSEGGIGIKSALDVWVFLKHYEAALDKKIIKERLLQIGLVQFEENIRGLCAYWFEGKEKNDIIDKLSAYIARSGWNGSAEVQKAIHANAEVKVSKLKYWFKYIFMSPGKLSKTFKVLRKHQFLVPFVWIYRIFSAVFVRKDAVKSFIHRYDGIEKEDILEIKKFIEYIGL